MIASPHLFIDESKARNYVMVAAAIAPSDVGAARAGLKALLMPGQRSLHFRNESDARRRKIIDTICDQGWSAVLVVSTDSDQRAARDACLRECVTFAARTKATRMTIETDESLVAHDRRLLFAASRAAEVVDRFEYRHMRRHEDAALWVPDALGWSYTRGGTWRTRIAPIVSAVIDLP